MNGSAWAKMARVRQLVLDVDGVLTDGGLYYGPDGEALKRFHAHDGMGVGLLRRAGIVVAVISGKRSAALERRLDELGIACRYLGVDNKVEAFDSLVRETGIGPDRTAYLGDDLSDVPLMKRVLVPGRVFDAHACTHEHAIFVTRRKGGHAAVRELADDILRARGLLEQTVDAYLSERGG